MSRHGWLVGFLLWGVTACGGGGSVDPVEDACTLPLAAESDCAAGSGTLELHFAVAQKARDSHFLRDLLKGTVHGDLFRPEHVSASGPTSDAVSLHNVRVDHVDFTESHDPNDESIQSFTAPLCAGKYKFLGFLDVDGNASTPPFADRGDPATLPGAEGLEFEVNESSVTKQTVVFGLTLACDVTCLNPPICML